MTKRKQNKRIIGLIIVGAAIAIGYYAYRTTLMTPVSINYITGGGGDSCSSCMVVGNRCVSRITASPRVSPKPTGSIKPSYIPSASPKPTGVSPKPSTKVSSSPKPVSPKPSGQIPI